MLRATPSATGSLHGLVCCTMQVIAQHSLGNGIWEMTTRPVPASTGGLASAGKALAAILN
jgi:hypothetical protein